MLYPGFKIPPTKNFDDYYSSQLRRHIKKNPNEGEYEFLLNQIEQIKSTKDRLNKINIREIVEFEHKEFIEKNKDNIDELNTWIDQRIRSKSEEISEHLKACEFCLLEYDIRISRITSDKKISKPLFKESKKIYNEFIVKHQGILSTVAPPTYNELMDFNDEYGLRKLEEEYCERITSVFEKEFNELKNSYVFFWGCTFDVYLRDYDKRKHEFFERFNDALDIDFIEQEAGNLLNDNFEKFSWMIWKNKGEQSELIRNIEYSKVKKRRFLEEEAMSMGYDLIFDFDDEYASEFFTISEHNNKHKSEPIKSNLVWNASQTDLMELIKALIETDAIKDSKEKGKQKELTNHLTSLFNIKINNPDKLITDLNKRNIGNETKFIDSLKKNLITFLQKENTRK